MAGHAILFHLQAPMVEHLLESLVFVVTTKKNLKKNQINKNLLKKFKKNSPKFDHVAPHNQNPMNYH